MLLGIMMIPAMVASCAVMSDEINSEAEDQPSFDELVLKTSVYQDRRVVVGGYVVLVQNQKLQTRIEAVQAPLGIGQQPKSKDLSQGRLILIYDGFIDPEVYTKERQITVGGPLMGSSTTERQNHPYPYLRIRIEEIHLWPKPQPATLDPFWDDECYYHPHGFRRYRYHPWCW